MLRRRERGFSLMEVVVATSIAVVMTGAITVAHEAHFGFIARSFEETVAARAAAGRLEEVGAGRGPLAEGVRAFALDPALARSLPRARGEERIRALEPGLFEVEAAVVWPDARERDAERRYALTTLVAREEKP